MSLISVCNFLGDTFFTAWYFRRRDDTRTALLRMAAGIICLLFTFFLYFNGVFAFLSGSVQRYVIRMILVFGFVILSRPMKLKTAVYAAVYWCTLHLLVQSFFFSPYTYPFFEGQAVLTGQPVADDLLCIIITLAVKGLFFLSYDRFTPVMNMSPVNSTDLVPLGLIAAIALYARELAIPLTTAETDTAIPLSSYYLILTLALTLLLGYIEFTRKSRNDRAAALLQRQEIEALQRNILVQAENERALSSLRHDLKNHLISLRLLAQEGKTDEVCATIDTLLQEKAQAHMVFHTGSTLADGLLSVKLDNEKTRNLDLKVNLDLRAGSFITGDDLCILLGNPIDNAIEACSAWKEGQPMLSVSGGVSANMLLIRIENSSAATPVLVGGLPVTIKPDAALHGFGLRNVKAVLEKYNGSLTITTDTPQRFILTMLIPIPVK